jgi:cell division protein FtsW (lipid II flippase)
MKKPFLKIWLILTVLAVIVTGLCNQHNLYQTENMIAIFIISGIVLLIVLLIEKLNNSKK